MPTNRFEQSLQHEALWFTRTYKWKDMDACEASLLPAYRRYLKKDLVGEIDYLYAKILMEYDLKANFGCCFSLFDKGEIDAMWRAYTPGPEYGVIILVSALSIGRLINNLSSFFKRKYLAKVEYISDAKANYMKVEKCKHSRTKKGNLSWDVSESHFYKREAFSTEKEVRVVLTHQDSWTDVFQYYVNVHNIKRLSISTPTPRDQPYFRTDIRKNMQRIGPDDYTIMLTVEQTKQLIEFIENNYISFFEDNKVANSKGMFIPFNKTNIIRVILHPALHKNKKQFLHIMMLKEKHGLDCDFVESVLYKNDW